MRLRPNAPRPLVPKSAVDRAIDEGVEELEAAVIELAKWAAYLEREGTKRAADR